jgi:hypothetical protein
MADKHLPSETSHSDENEAAWHEALVCLERGDTRELAALLRGGRAVPSNARRAMAELLDPETGILDMHLVLKKGGRAKAEQRMSLRSRAIVELEKRRAKGLSTEDAAEASGQELGISGRMVLKRADLRNPTWFARGHREISKLIGIAELSGDPKKFFQILLETVARAFPWKPGS